jgi:hypothetical protein
MRMISVLGGLGWVKKKRIELVVERVFEEKLYIN